MEDNFIKELKKRILLLDGGISTFIQTRNFQESDFRGRQFINHPIPLYGFYEILNLTKPSEIKSLHLEYLKAGADIIKTNTFNANPISMRVYDLNFSNVMSEQINREGAEIAKEAIADFEKGGDKKPRFVAGVIGPSDCGLSNNNAGMKGNITFGEMHDAYKYQVRGLIDGGVDLLMCETCYDFLNLKAALSAIESIFVEKKIKLPIIVSFTIFASDNRIWSGQSIESMVESMQNYETIKIIGFNCSNGPHIFPSLIKTLNKVNPYFTSFHPNAGLPDCNGTYPINPEIFKSLIEPLINNEELNIVGGCCGTTPEYIKLLSEAIRNKNPRKIKFS